MHSKTNHESLHTGTTSSNSVIESPLEFVVPALACLSFCFVFAVNAARMSFCLASVSAKTIFRLTGVRFDFLTSLLIGVRIALFRADPSLVLVFLIVGSAAAAAAASGLCKKRFNLARISSNPLDFDVYHLLQLILIVQPKYHCCCRCHRHRLHHHHR